MENPIQHRKLDIWFARDEACVTCTVLDEALAQTQCCSHYTSKPSIIIREAQESCLLKKTQEL